MDLVLLLDIDGTLTPPRKPLRKEMAEALKRLVVPFHLAAGSDLPLVSGQFLEPLHKFGFEGEFDAFLSNGAARYRCTYSSELVLEKLSEFNFRRHLGEDGYRFLVESLKATLERKEFQLPNSIQVIGSQIVDRGPMINFCPIGRPQQEALKTDARRLRQQFVKHDQENQYRQIILLYLQKILSGLIGEKDLRIMLGGQTSFDIVIKGKDKTNAVHELLDSGVKKVMFFGDALFEGGNDYPIIQYINEWQEPDRPCPLEAVPVEGWRDTIQIFTDNNWLS